MQPREAGSRTEPKGRQRSWAQGSISASPNSLIPLLQPYPAECREEQRSTRGARTIRGQQPKPDR